MATDLQIASLKQRLQSQPLPGMAAQKQMAPIGRSLPQTPPEDAKQAAVLAMLFEKPSYKTTDWQLVLIERVARKQDRHGGQISLPGGKYEESDGQMAITALRETEEEIGVPQKAVELLGALTPLYIPVSNFQVHPFVGFLADEPRFQLQATEVESLIQLPLSLLCDSNKRLRKDIPLYNGILLPDVPYFDFYGHTVWGATAMILSELAAVLSA